jgi:hypothetical protein
MTSNGRAAATAHTKRGSDTIADRLSSTRRRARMRERKSGRRRARLLRGRAIIVCQSLRLRTTRDMLISPHTHHGCHLFRRHPLYRTAHPHRLLNSTTMIYRPYRIASRAIFTPHHLAFLAHHPQTLPDQPVYVANRSIMRTAPAQAKTQAPISSCSSPRRLLQPFQMATNHEPPSHLPLLHQSRLLSLRL